MYAVINPQELMTKGKVSLNNSRWNQAEGTALDYYIESRIVPPKTYY